MSLNDFPLPVIIGAGIAGLSARRVLARAGALEYSRCLATLHVLSAAPPASLPPVWKDPSPAVKELRACLAAWGPPPAILESQIHRWRYGEPSSVLPEAFWDVFPKSPQRAPIFIAGDAFGGPSLEGAFASGRAAALALLARPPPPPGAPMLKYLFGSSNLSSLTTFVTPNFFSVLRLGDSAKIGSRLYRNYGDASAWSATLRAAPSWAKGLVETLRERDDFSPTPLCPPDAEVILEAFFTQILCADTWILDFRAERWGRSSSAKLSWKPAPYYYSPSPAFRDGVRNLYLGFYRKDGKRFRAAVKVLGLEAAELELRRHFGLEDQRGVIFRLSDFQSTFAAIFTACERAGTRIDAEFSVLGLLLLTLYNALESVGTPLDVRSAFARAELRSELP